MSTFFKKTSIYFFANILNAAIPFLLLPILTRYLSVEEYGQIAMFQLLITGLSGVIGLNTVGAAGRKFYDRNITKSDLAIYNTNCLWILLFTILIFTFVDVLFGREVSFLLSIPSQWVYFALIMSISSFIIKFRLNQWQIRGEAKKYGVLQISNSLFNFSGSLIFVVILSMGVQGRIDAMLISAVMMAIVSFYLLFKGRLISMSFPNKRNIYEALNFGAPLVPHVFGAFLLSSADRYVINDSLGIGAAGIYLLAVQLSSVMLIIFDAINKSYVPWLFKNLSENNDLMKIKIVKNTYRYFLILIIIAFLGFHISPWGVEVIAGDEFADASLIIGYLLVGQVFGGMYLMVTNYVFYSKNTFSLSVVTIICGAINVILMIVFVRLHGVKGAAIAYTLSKAIQFFLTWVLAIKAVRMPWFYFFKR